MSPFIERLGWVLIHSLWQLALLAAAAFVVQRGMQRTSAAARYAALLALLGLVVAAPLITWSVLPTRAVLPVAELPAPAPALAPVPTPKQEPPAPVLTPAPVTAGATAPITPVAPAPLEPILPVKAPEPLQLTWSQWAQQSITPWLSTIVWGWSLGVLAFAIRPLWSWFTVRQLRTQGVSPVSESVQAALAETARRLGISQAVRVLQSTIVQVPVVAGYLKPVILLPASIVTGLPASQLEAILAHELAHIRRHDYLANLIQTLVETVFFYHPAVWWLSHQIRSERENCCDDIAVAMLGNRLDYSRALLAVEELRGSPTTLAVGASGGSLLGRVRRLFHRDVEPGSLSSGSMALGVVLVVGVLAIAAIAGSRGASAPKSEDDAFVGPVANETSWPQLGGSAAHNAISPVTNLPTQFHLDRKENIRWSQPIEDFAFSSPVVSGGKVLIGTNNSIGRDPRFPASIDRACLQCFDERTGEFLWQYSSPKMEQGRRHDWPSIGICSTPVIEGDRVWFATNRCEIVCLDLNWHRDNEDDGEPEASAPGDSDATAKTLTPNPSPGGRGEPENQRADVVWKYDMFNTLGVRPLNATCVTPVIAGDLLLLNSGNDVDESYMNVPAPEAPAFLAFHKTTGQLIWSDKTPNSNILGNGCSMGAPAVAKIDGVWQAIFAGYDGWLYAFDLECIQRGETLLLWEFDLNPKESQYRLSGPRNEFTYRGLPATPVVVGDHVFAAVGHNPERGEGLGRLWCIDATKRGDLSSDLVYNKAAPEVVIPHKRVQACEPDKGDFTRPNPNSGVEWVYTTDDLNKNGKIEYEEQMHLSNSLPAIHDGLLLTTDLSGLVHCLDVTTGELLWTHDQLATCWSGPLLADGKAWVIDEDGDLSIFALSREKQLIAEIAMNSPGWTNFAAANQTLYVATKTQLVAIGSGEFPKPDGVTAKLPGGLEIELVGVTPNSAATAEGWRPDGSPIVGAGDWPRGAMFSRNGDRFTVTTDSASKLTPDPLARDILFECRGATSSPSWTITRQSGWTEFQALNVESGLRRRLSLQRKDQALNTTVEMAYTDSPWGPWQRIGADGKRINSIETFAPDQQLYSDIRIERIGSSPNQNEKGSPLELVLNEPATGNDYQSGVFAIEVRLISKSQKVLPTFAAPQPMKNGRRTVTWRTAEAVPLESLQYAEFRLRPYRHFITFENVPLEKSAAGKTTVKHRSIPEPPRRTPDNRFVVRLPDGLEIELLRIVRNDLPVEQSWLPNGEVPTSVIDWPHRSFFQVNENSVSSSNDGPGSNRVWDFAYAHRPTATPPLVSVEYGDGSSYSATSLGQLGLRTIALAPKDPAQLTKFQMQVGTEPWGQWIQVGADGKVLNPEAINKKSNSPDPLIWIAGAGIDEDNPDRSWFKWMALPHANQLYSMEVRAIDDEGQSHQFKSVTHKVTAATMHEITQWFDLPVEKLNRFEYRMRPYRHLVTYDNICTDPKKPTEVRVSVEPIVYPNEAAVEKSRLLMLNPDNTPWQGSLVAAHIGFIPPDAKAWNAWVDKDGQADLSALPAGKHWLISRFPWSVIPVETPLQQTVRQPLRLGTPPKKHSSSNYSGNLSVQRDEQGREFIQCDFYNNTDELWSFSELDLTLEAGWFSTESQGHSPQWLGDTLAEVPQIEIPPGQKGSLRIDWSEWAKRGVWDPMSGPQAVSKPVLPDQEPGKIWVRISGPGFGTNPVAVMHPDKLLAVSGEPVPQPPAPDEVDGPRVNLVGLTWNRAPKNDAWEPTGNPMPVPGWAKSITQLASAEMSDVPVLLYEVHGLKGTPSINFHESSITTGDGELTGSVFRQALLRLRTRDEYRNVPPKVSVSDEPWGPWRIITKSGAMAAPVPEDSPYRTGYASVTAHGIRPLQRNAQVQGLIIHHPTGFRDLYDLEVEEVWLDPTNSPSNIPRGDSIPLGNGPSTRLEIEYPLSSYDNLKEYRYRIRPYRHKFVFENVNYAPSQNPSNYTPFKTVYTKLEHDLPIQQPEPQDRPRLNADSEAEARAELERLAITEPGNIHATRRATANPNGWKWSVYLPPGKTWRLYCESGMIPKWQDIQPTAETTSDRIGRKDEHRIIELEAYVSTDTYEDGKLKLWVEADRSFLQAGDWVAWKIAPQVADYITGRTQTSGTTNLNLDIGGVNTLNAGRNRFCLILIHRRFHEANDKGNVEPEFMPGFCVWIQADPEVPKEPTVEQANPKAQIALVQNLSSHDQSIRDRAAAQLKSEFKPSAKEPWQAKVDSIPKNAPRAEVIAKLGIDEKRDLYGAEDTMEQYRLDDTWMVRIWFTGDLQNLNTIELIEQLHRPWVDPPVDFTGTWVTYYVNGTKAHEIEYLNGKYHGRHRSYHANGRLLVQQHFVDDVAHGEDTGYDASGNLSYRGLYENGKQVGPWIHYNEDGSERSRTEHPAPNPSKPQPSRLTFEPVEGRVLLLNGQPAADVPVVLRRMPWGQHLLPQQVEKEPEDPHDLAHTVTDAQGQFAFRDVPLYRGRDEVKLDVVAKLDSHAVAWSRVIVGTPVTLTLQPEAKLTGKITGPSGQPVAGAVIQAAWIMSLRHITQADLEEGRWPSWKDRSFVGLTDCQLVPTAKTNENGEFKLSGLPRGLGMRLFVRSEDFEPQWFDAATSAIEGENLRLAKRPVASGPLTIRMQTPRELLTIRVVDDATGAPLEGAKVIAHPSGKLPVSQTGNESVFRLAAGDVAISAELPIEKGYLRGWGLFEAGQAQNAEIRLKRGIPLRGRVIDQETKQPLAGIEVRVDGRLEEIQIGNACLWSKTGNDGSFELLLSQGKHIAWVRPFKSIYRDVGVSMLDGQFGVMAHQSATIDTNQLPDTLELALERAQGIEGVVLDPQGELAAGVQYRGLYKTDYGAQSFGDVTTEQGEFVISEPLEAEPLARSVPLDVLFWDEQRGLVGTLRVDPVDPSVAHEVELQPAGQVTGRVVDDQGRPVAHALVQCGLMFPSFTRQTGAVIARPVRTSEDGRFEIRSGVAGYRLDLEVDRPGYVRAWKTLSLTRTEQDKDLGDIVLEIEKPVQKLTVELPKLQGLTPEAQYTALSGSFDSLVQQVDAARKVARNYDVVPDNTSQLYAQAMWDVAQSARAGDVERKALVWMVGMRRLSGNHGAEYEKLRQQAGARLIEAYADQPDVAAVADSVAWTQYSLPEGTHRAALVFLEKSPDRSARGICCLLAAESLVDWGPVRSRPIAPETISRVEPLLKRVVSEFADLPHADDWRKGTLGDCAQGWLETLQQVQQGVAVPDMAWKDSLGQPLRISDLKGKVVVLDHGTLSDDSFSRTLLNQAGPDRVIVIQVSHQNVETAWKALDGLAVPRRQISYEEANRFERMWNIRTWPGAIVLNERGGIAGEDLREKLPEVLSSVLKPKVEPLKLGTGARIDPAQSPPAGTSSNHNPSGNRRGLGRWSAVTG